jgi:hypothetical protein
MLFLILIYFLSFPAYTLIAPEILSLSPFSFVQEATGGETTDEWVGLGGWEICRSGNGTDDVPGLHTEQEIIDMLLDSYLSLSAV